MTRRPRIRLMLLLTAITLAISASPARTHAQVDPGSFFAALSKHIESLEGVDVRAKSLIQEALSQRTADSDNESLLLETVVLVSPTFAAAMDDYDDEDYEGCVNKLTDLNESEDPYIRMNARAYTARALVHMDKLVEAQVGIKRLLDETEDLRSHTLAEPELRYMLGYCQVQNLEHEAARATLERFLEDFPNASPRLVVTAKQMLAELARRIPDGMGEIADLMTFSEKRLAAADTTERVLDSQARILDLLDDLIKQVEEMEKQQQQNPSSNQSQAPQPKPKPTPNQPAGELQPQRTADNDTSKAPGRRVAPGEAWGTLPEADRQRILQVLKDRFPGRYRALVEQYYESLAQEP